MIQEQPQTTLVDLGLITHVIPEDQEPTSLYPHDKLLCWHYRLGHLYNNPSAFSHARNPFAWPASMVRCQSAHGGSRQKTKTPEKQPHGTGRLSPWTNWSPTLMSSSPNLRASSYNNDISMLRFLWTSSLLILLYTSSTTS